MRPQTANQKGTTRRAVNITFRPELELARINQIVKVHREALSKTEWTFNFEEYRKRKVKEVFEAALVLLIETLNLHFCKQPSIIREMQAISFPRLKMLYLCGNRICSVEPLQTVNLETLERLYLRDNFITSLRCLRKCNAKLKELDISENQIVDIALLWSQFDLSRLQILSAGHNPIVLDYSIMRSKASLTRLYKIIALDTLTVNTNRLKRDLEYRSAIMAHIVNF